MRNALKTLMKLSLKMEWMNTDDNDGDNDEEDKKNWLAFSWVRKCRLKETTIRVKMLRVWCLIFAQRRSVKRFFFFFTFIFDLFFSNMRHIHKTVERYGDCGLSCVRVIIAPFLRKLAVGLSLQWQMRWRFHAVAPQLLLKRWQNAERHSCQCHMESCKMEWAIFALASAQMSLPNW